MMHYPEDGSLAEITASVPAVNTIIIQRSDAVSESDEPNCLFATFDRTKEGVEWPGDQFLDKLTPDLPKMKVPKINKPEVTTKTYTQRRDHLRKKYKQRSPQRENHFASRRPRPPYKSRTNHHNHHRIRTDHNHHYTRPDHNRHHKRPDHNHHQKRPDHNHHNRPENSQDIDPWIKPQPWLQTGVNTVPGISTQISHMPHNNVYAQNSDSSHIFDPNTISNNCNFPVAASDISFINSHVKNPSRPPTANRMSGGSSFQPDRFLHQHSVHPERGFFGPGTGPTQNRESDGPNNMPGLLGEAPGVRYNAKPPLLGNYPLPNRHFNKNIASRPNKMFALADPEASSGKLTRNQKNLDDQNSFVSSTKNSSLKKSSNDTGYGRTPRNNFNQYDNDIEISGLKSHDSASAVNPYEDQYRDSYNHLDGKFQNNNNKNGRSLENSSGSYKASFGRFKRRGVGRFKSGHREEGNNNLRENSYNKSQVSNMSKPFMNNQNRIAMEEPIIHISDSAVVYNQEDFPSDEYSTPAMNSAPRLNQNSVSRSNIRQSTQIKRTQGTTNKFTNNRHYRINYNQGRRRGNWRTPRK